MVDHDYTSPDLTTGWRSLLHPTWHVDGGGGSRFPPHVAVAAEEGGFGHELTPWPKPTEVGRLPVFEGGTIGSVRV